MKVNKLLNFLGDSGYESKAIRYIYVYLIALGLLVWQFFTATGQFPDTKTYYIAADRLLNGEWHVSRTPIYPAIIAIGKILLGVRGYYFTVGVQVIAFFLSAVILQRLSVKLCGSKRVTFWIVTAYLIFVTLSSFPVRILTDSLGTSGVVFMLWYLLRKYPTAPNVTDLCSASGILILLIFLRPFFIYLLPVLAVYYLGILWTQRAKFKTGFLTGAAGLVIAIGFIQLYRTAMYHNFGIQSISIVSSVNNYFPVRAAVEPNPDLTDNPKMKAYLKELKNRGFQADSILNELRHLRSISTDKEFESYVGKQLSQNRVAVLKKIAGRAYVSALPSVYLPIHYSDWLICKELSWRLPSMTVYFLFILIYAIGWVKVWRHNRQIPLPSLLLLMISAGATCASIIGAQAEWSRLSLPGFPALLIMIAIALSTTSVSLKKYYTR